MRTYLPTIYRTAQFLVWFISKHRVRILKTLGADKAVELDTLLAACSALIAIIAPYVTPTS